MKFKEAQCDICGKKYLVNKHISLNKFHACDDCKGKKKHICKICGKVFIGSLRQKICSNECKKINNILPTLIKYFNFDKTVIGTIQIFNELDKIKNILYNEYWIEHHSSTEICKKYNYPNISNLTGKIFVYLNIKPKSIKESIKESILFNRLNPSFNYKYKQQWHTSWNNKKVFLRSSYELDYAKELDEQQIDYEVEFKHIKYWDSQKQEYRCAIPDFYIPKDNMIVEVKSNYTLDKQNMIDKKKTYLDLGYKFKLICEHKELEI